jgi:transposase-like protein
MKKYSTEFKLKVVKRYLAGEGGAKLLARQWAVIESIAGKIGFSAQTLSGWIEQH